MKVVDHGVVDAFVRQRLDRRVVHGDGGWVFMGVEPFSHRRRGVPILVSTDGRGVMSWGVGGDFR